MFCSLCGTYNDKTAVICVNCGAELGIESNEDLICPVCTHSNEEITEKCDILEGEGSIIPEEAEKPSKVKEYILWSIISAVLFSIPFGTAAVVFSGFASTERKAGNLEKAKAYSQRTRFFCIISTFLAGVKAITAILILLYFLIKMNH